MPHLKYFQILNLKENTINMEILQTQNNDIHITNKHMNKISIQMIFSIHFLVEMVVLILEMMDFMVMVVMLDIINMVEMVLMIFFHLCLHSEEGEVEDMNKKKKFHFLEGYSLFYQ